MARIKAGEQAAEITMKSKDARMERLRKLFGIKYLHELFPRGCTPNGADFKHQTCSGDVLRDLCQIGQNLINRRKSPKQCKEYTKRHFTPGRVVIHQDVKELMAKLKANPIAAMVRATLKFQKDVEKAKAEGLETPLPPGFAITTSGNPIGTEVHDEAGDEAEEDATRDTSLETISETGGKAEYRKRKRPTHRKDSSSPFYVDNFTAAPAKLRKVRRVKRGIRRNTQTLTGADINGNRDTIGFSPLPTDHDFAAILKQNKCLSEQNQRLTSTLKSANDFNEQMKEMFEQGQNGADTAEIAMLLIRQGIENYGCEQEIGLEG